jgi:hypothetical protein
MDIRAAVVRQMAGMQFMGREEFVLEGVRLSLASARSILHGQWRRNTPGFVVRCSDLESGGAMTVRSPRMRHLEFQS